MVEFGLKLSAPLNAEKGFLPSEYCSCRMLSPLREQRRKKRAGISSLSQHQEFSFLLCEPKLKSIFSFSPSLCVCVCVFLSVSLSKHRVPAYNMSSGFTYCRKNNGKITAILVLLHILVFPNICLLLFTFKSPQLAAQAISQSFIAWFTWKDRMECAYTILGRI